MKPIGFTLKNDGELMVIHVCLRCGTVSPNRIAGDDNAYVIVQLMNDTVSPDVNVTDQLHTLNIHLISREERSLALTAILGYEYKKSLG